MTTQIYQISSLTIKNDLVKKVADIKNIIIAAGGALVAGALFVIASSTNMENDTVNMLMLIIGALLLAYSLYLFFNNNQKLIYAPSHSDLNHYICYIEPSQRQQAERWAESAFSSSAASEFTKRDDGSTRFDILMSEDRSFAAIQLSVYENFRYDPCGKVCYLYKDDVKAVEKLID